MEYPRSYLLLPKEGIKNIVHGINNEIIEDDSILEQLLAQLMPSFHLKY